MLGLLAFAVLGLPQNPTQLPACEWLKPYKGWSVKGVDNRSMLGKILCGYQGWHCAEGDQAQMGWYHYQGHNGFKDGSCCFDLWPDTSELPAKEKYVTPFVLANGRAAYLPSSDNPETVIRHFQWMKKYGIDGVFVQRFVGELRDKIHRNHFTKVLDSCRTGANQNGRVFAVMYDLSGLPKGGTSLVKEDWTDLRQKMRITDNPAYLQHRGKPLVAIWGVGFNDNRQYTVAECLDLVKFLQHDGCRVMVGVPTYWRTQDRDCLKDPLLTELFKTADVISPWTVGRFGTPEAARNYAGQTVKPDLAQCAEWHVDYLPVAFPGFSWHNLKASSPLNQIPRLKGAFLTTQFEALKAAGAKMVYQAMFDEIDEGTAIFKVTNETPVGESKFADFEGLPSDFYLKLVGTWTKTFRTAAR